MRLQTYLKEDRLDEMSIKTRKDLTTHTHDAIVNADGDGKTVNTNKGEEHEHIIYQWLIQPAHGHIHNLEE